ncbi:hypothetical protein R1sor_002414 [Riccia sorocarpa]|uniref:Uncharacterized protein n=1 Tax=Riccia sorocarpa TaxID=122646 RepID=A0ABD3GYQ9_9MARC
MTVSSNRADMKEEAAASIREWCEEKGTELYLDDLLKLLDIEYLRTWPGISHISFPKRKARLPDGSIPNKHWWYRFYHGCAAVLGWQDRVTYGDERYFGSRVHAAVKNLWPDELQRAPAQTVKAESFAREESRRPASQERYSSDHVVTERNSTVCTSMAGFPMAPLTGVTVQDSNETPEFEADATLLSSIMNVPFSTGTPRMPRKTRLVSASSAQQPVVVSPLRSPMRVRMQETPIFMFDTNSSFCETELQSHSQFQHTSQAPNAHSRWSLRHAKGLARQNVRVSFETACADPHGVDRTGDNLTGDNDSGDSGNDSPIERTAPPGRLPPRSIRHLSKWRAYSKAKEATAVPELDKGKLPILEIPTTGLESSQPYVTRQLFRELNERGSSAGDVSHGVDTATESIKTSVLRYVGVEFDVFTDGAEELISGTILSATFQSESESEWTDDESTSQDNSSDSDEDPDLDAAVAEIIEEDLPRLGVLKLDPTFNQDPFEWQMADENWPSAQTTFSHSTDFLGTDEEPTPAWFYTDCTKQELKDLTFTNAYILYLQYKREQARQSGAPVQILEVDDLSDGNAVQQHTHGGFLLAVADAWTKKQLHRAQVTTHVDSMGNLHSR